MDDLVKRLSKEKKCVTINRPDKSAQSLLNRIKIKYVHVLFDETGTEIGIQLDLDSCNVDQADFDQSVGQVHLEGVLTLNYEKVKCIVDMDLSTMKGEGYLKSIEGEEYQKIIERR